MSRAIMPYSINGIVQMGHGTRFFRIDNLSSMATGAEFMQSPAALVRIDDRDPKASHSRALAVVEALNSHHAQALMKVAMEAHSQ